MDMLSSTYPLVRILATRLLMDHRHQRNLAALATRYAVGLMELVTPEEYRRLLAEADRLVAGGSDRGDAGTSDPRKQRSDYLPWRNRAIIYVLLETGMRRAGVTSLLQDTINWIHGQVTIAGKGGKTEVYAISPHALTAVSDYLKHEREQDAEYWRGQPAIFLAANSIRRGDGQLTNRIWDAVCNKAGVINRNPHSARHHMGNRIMKKTGNAAAVAKQLNHTRLEMALAYSAPTFNSIRDLLNEN